MIYFPKLEYRKDYIYFHHKYSSIQIEAFIYGYMKLGLTFKNIELLVLNKDSLGYDVMKVLQYLGIDKRYMGLYKNTSDEAIETSLAGSVQNTIAIKNALLNNYDNKDYLDMFGVPNINSERRVRRYFKDSDIDENTNLMELEAYYNAEMRVRNSSVQRKFRLGLLDEFDSKCALCNIKNTNLLVASHILPYSKCNGDLNKAGDRNNGLLLCVMHDALFESGHYITFDECGNIQIDENIPKELYKDLNINDRMKLDSKFVNNKRKKYLIRHNLMFLDCEFKKGK